MPLNELKGLLKANNVTGFTAHLESVAPDDINVALLYATSHRAQGFNAMPFVKVLLEKGANVNFKLTDAQATQYPDLQLGAQLLTPLMYSCCWDSNPDLVKFLLLDNNAGVFESQYRDKLGTSALHRAAGSGRVDSLKVLVDYTLAQKAKGNPLAILDLYSKTGTPLIWAARAKLLAVAQILVNGGADVAERFNGSTPFEQAPAGSEVEQYLLDHLVNAHGPQVLYKWTNGASGDDLAPIFFTLANKQKYGDNTKKLEAVLNKLHECEVLKEALDYHMEPVDGVTTRQVGKTITHYAVKDGSHAAVQKLLEYGANPIAVDTQRDAFVLVPTLAFGDEKMVRLVMSHMQHSDVATVFTMRHGPKHDVPLLNFATTNTTLIIKLAQEYGVKLETDYVVKLEGAEFTPLGYAARTGDLEGVKALISVSANPNHFHDIVLSSTGEMILMARSPLDDAISYAWAAKYPHLSLEQIPSATSETYNKIVIELLKAGAEVSSTSRIMQFKDLLLPYLCEVVFNSGDGALIEDLLGTMYAAGVDLNAIKCQYDGNKPLMEKFAPEFREQVTKQIEHFSHLDKVQLLLEQLSPEGLKKYGISSETELKKLCGQEMSYDMLREYAVVLARQPEGIEFEDTVTSGEKKTMSLLGLWAFKNNLVDSACHVLELKDPKDGSPLMATDQGLLNSLVNKLSETTKSGNVEHLQKYLAALPEFLKASVLPILFKIACESGAVNVLDILKATGIDIKAKFKDGDYAVHKAAKSSHPDTVLKWLQSNGVSLEARDVAGKTAYDIVHARIVHHEEPTQMFINATIILGYDDTLFAASLAGQHEGE